MAPPFPTDRPLSPHQPPVTGLFERGRDLQCAQATLAKGELLALWAPRYSGRSTFLRCLEDHLGRADRELAVYVSADLHLDPASREALFCSFAAQIASEVRLSRPGRRGRSTTLDKRHDWRRPDALVDALRQILERSGLLRLTVLLDDCDKLLSGALLTLLRSLRELRLSHTEPGDELLRRLRFVIAGAASFRYLELLDPADLSPLDDWAVCRLHDLEAGEAKSYLAAAFRAVEVAVEEDALEAIVEYAGGDLRRLNAFAHQLLDRSGHEGIAAGIVVREAERLLRDDKSDPSLVHMLGMIAQDPRCLAVVESLRDGEAEFLPDHLDRDQGYFFGISNQELCGGFVLLREDDKPVRWRVRNRFCREVLHRHFSTRRLFQCLLHLGLHDRLERHVDRLSRELAVDLREDVLRFDEPSLRNVIEWFWGRGGERDRIAAGFEALEFVLQRVFGLREFYLYEADSTGQKLVGNELLSSGGPPADAGAVIDLASAASRELREVRVFRAGSFEVAIAGGTHLKVMVPLRDFTGRTSGVLSLRTERFMEDWATLLIRVPILERAVNWIWQRLTRYEAESHRALRQISESLASREGETAPARGVPLFIAAKFETDIYRQFERNRKRFPDAFTVSFLEARSGIVFSKLIQALEAVDSFLIFDLSRNNNNVLFELGLAVGLNRPGLPLYAMGSDFDPDLLQGIIRGKYRLHRPLGGAVFELLQDRWLAYQRHRQEEGFIHLLDGRVASPMPRKPFLLVIDHNLYRDAPAFRRVVAASAARVGLEPFYLWDAEGGFTSGVLMEEDLVLHRVFQLVDAAAAVLARIEKVEDRSLHASRFIAAGLAKGLERRRGRKNVLLAARSNSPEGDRIPLPSDLKGVSHLAFDPGMAKSFGKQLLEMMAVLTRRPGG